jgi:hypothetical protein
MRPLNVARAKVSRERQLELRKRTGFAGDNHERAHEVEWLLLSMGYTRIEAKFAAALVATADEWNWQGMRRLSYWIGNVSMRTLRRARAKLERLGLLQSCLLLPGDMVPGQRAPVRQPMVVRNVTAIVALLGERVGRNRGKVQRGRHSRQDPSDRSGGGPSNSSVAHAPAARSADDFEQLAAKHADSEWGEYFVGIAASLKKGPEVIRRKPEPKTVPRYTPEEIEAWERETERLEQLVREREQRGPPH